MLLHITATMVDWDDLDSVLAFLQVVLDERHMCVKTNYLVAFRRWRPLEPSYQIQRMSALLLRWSSDKWLAKLIITVCLVYRCVLALCFVWRATMEATIIKRPWQLVVTHAWGVNRFVSFQLLVRLSSFLISAPDLISSFIWPAFGPL